MIDIDDVVVCQGLRIVADFNGRLNGSRNAFFVFKNFQPFIPCFGGKSFIQYCNEFLCIFTAGFNTVEPFVIFQTFDTERFTEYGPISIQHAGQGP